MLVKIGLSMNPQNRLGFVRWVAKEKITLPEKPSVVFTTEFMPTKRAHATERCVHHYLQHRRFRGEWFAITPEEAVAAIQAIVTRFPRCTILQSDRFLIETKPLAFAQLPSMSDLFSRTSDLRPTSTPKKPRKKSDFVTQAEGEN